MKKFRFNEVSGKRQGKVFIAEAETIDEAIEKMNADEVIKPGQKFSTLYFENIYEVSEYGNPVNVRRIVHLAKLPNA